MKAFHRFLSFQRKGSLQLLQEKKSLMKDTTPGLVMTAWIIPQLIMMEKVLPGKIFMEKMHFTVHEMTYPHEFTWILLHQFKIMGVRNKTLDNFIVMKFNPYYLLVKIRLKIYHMMVPSMSIHFLMSIFWQILKQFKFTGNFWSLQFSYYHISFCLSFIHLFAWWKVI